MRPTKESMGLTTALIVAVTAAAAAVGASKDPKALVLQKADLPATAAKGPSFAVAPSTFGDREFTVYYNLRVAGREEVVTSEVAVSRAGEKAKAGYRLMLAAYTAYPGMSPLTLSLYGSEQRPEFQAAEGRAVLVVRKDAVVWHLEVESCNARSPAGCLGGRTPPKLTKAQAVSELRKYARKQQARIGNGQIAKEES